MKSVSRIGRKTLCTTLMMTGLAAALLGCATARSPGASDLSAEQPSGSVAERLSEIAFVGMDGQIYTVDRMGRNLAPVTVPPEDGKVRYTLPTWSPDGTRLAFISLRDTGRSGAAYGIHVAEAGSTARQLFSSQTAPPIYLYWAPRNNALSFIIGDSRRQVAFYLADLRTGDLTRLDTGRPFYWDWSFNGRSIITHTGGVGGTDPGRLSLISWNDGTRLNTDIPLATAYFQSPAFSPAGTAILTAIRGAMGGSYLTVLNLDGSIRETIAPLQGIAMFSWSPTGNSIAYIDGSPSRMFGTVGTLKVQHLKAGRRLTEAPLFRAQGTRQLTVSHTNIPVFHGEPAYPPERVSAFFWSPDGRKIVYFVPNLRRDEDGGVLMLFTIFILDTEAETIRQIGTFPPAEEFARQIVPFHDQFQRSHTIWSPDSEMIVINAIAGDGNPAIFGVSASDPSPKPRLLAHGTLPFWAPRNGSR